MQRAVVLGCVVLCCLASSTWSQEQDEAEAAVVRANNKFSLSLYKELSKNPGNVFFSSIGVHSILSLAWLGATGMAHFEMAEGLGLPASRAQVQRGFKALMNHIQGATSGNITLDMANKIYAQNASEILPEFQRVAKEDFLSDVEELDFVNNGREAVNSVNRWVQQKTRNKIKNILSEDDIKNSDIALILVNAIYFKGIWDNQFDKELTQLRPFHTNAKSSHQVEMMKMKSNFNYANILRLNAQGLQLQYTGKELSMLILLPNDVEGLAALESQLNEQLLEKILGDFFTTEVEVFIPKFKLTEEMNLVEPLKNLGMTEMFDIAANFSGISENPLRISDVVQKSFVEVNEEGSEAAAASAVYVEHHRPLPRPPPIKFSFNADHPFLFFIRKNDCGTILFMGRIEDPK